MRKIEFICGFTENPLGSVLVSYGNTKVLCTVVAEDGVPTFKKDSGEGWLTAEYSMLPGSPLVRKKRRTISGELDGRTVEISRLIGRSVRSAIDLSLVGERTLYVDCDVLQADGGTRTAAISGSYLALRLAIDTLMNERELTRDPILRKVAAVSVGIVDGTVHSDLCFQEDSRAEIDCNIVMDDKDKLIEIQATGEKNVFSRDELNELLDVATEDIHAIFKAMEESYEDYCIRHPKFW
ncbi:ribonuclease PH [Guggenheimella bovis]